MGAGQFPEALQGVLRWFLLLAFDVCQTVDEL
jgi:hypothetical protein